jgi:hypothetical protein
MATKVSKLQYLRVRNTYPCCVQTYTPTEGLSFGPLHDTWRSHWNRPTFATWINQDWCQGKRKKNEFLRTERSEDVSALSLPLSHSGSFTGNREAAMFMIYDAHDVDYSIAKCYLSSHLNGARFPEKWWMESRKKALLRYTFIVWFLKQ